MDGFLNGLGAGVPSRDRLWLFVMGEKEVPTQNIKGTMAWHGATCTRSRSSSMFVLLLLGTIFWYVGPLKETKAKVTFLLILHPLRSV